MAKVVKPGSVPATAVGALKVAGSPAAVKPKKPSRAEGVAAVQARGPWTFDRVEIGDFVAVNGGKGKRALIFKNGKGEEIACGETYARKYLNYTPEKKKPGRPATSLNTGAVAPPSAPVTSAPATA